MAEKRLSKRKRRKAMPVQSICRNCGTRTVGRYCHVCGQDLFAGTSHRLRDVAGNSFDIVFTWDNKIWRSLMYLVAFPGRLTREYLDGRIVRYIHPSKLFWFLTIIFFALLWSQVKFDEEALKKAVAESAASADAENMEPDAGLKGITVNLGTEELDWDTLNDKISWPEFKGFLSAWSPYLVLLLTPFFALLIYVFFKRKDYYYADYLIFSLHFHSFIFLLLSVMLVLRMVFPGMGGTDVFLIWIPITYLGVSLWTVYRPRITAVVLRTLLIVMLYGILMTTVAALFIILYYQLFLK